MSWSENKRFCDTALRSGLLTEDHLRSLVAELGRTQSFQPSEAEAWDRALADLAVKKGWLTEFQAREIVSGRTRFRLGRYMVLDEIGRGGMGQVFLAEHLMLGRRVALKVLPRQKATEDSEAAFRREMRMLARLDHEALVRAFDAGIDGGVHYLVTELIEGKNLNRFVKQFGPLNELDACSVVAQIARGLAYIHERKMVHRDIKPGNIVITPDGKAKLIDLGLAGSEAEGDSWRDGRIVGTMDYISPEQVTSPKDVGQRSDVYSLGCTFYYTLTGRVPFPGGDSKHKRHRHVSAVPTPIAHLKPELSHDVCQLIDEMMAKSPLKRLDAVVVSSRLENWLPDGGLISPAVSFPVTGGAAFRDSPSSGVAPSGSFLGDHLPEPQEMPPAMVFAPRDDLVELRFWIEKVSRALANALLPAFFVGIMIAVFLAAVRSIDDKKFFTVTNGQSPLYFGVCAFALTYAALVTAKLIRRF